MPCHIILPFFFIGIALGINNAKTYYKSKKSQTDANINDF